MSSALCAIESDRSRELSGAQDRQVPFPSTSVGTFLRRAQNRWWLSAICPVRARRRIRSGRPPLSGLLPGIRSEYVRLSLRRLPRRDFSAKNRPTPLRSELPARRTVLATPDRDLF